MAQIRLENITAQKREIDNLRLQLESGAAGSRTPPPRAADPLINDLIKTIGISFQVDMRHLSNSFCCFKVLMITL